MGKYTRLTPNDWSEATYLPDNLTEMFSVKAINEMLIRLAKIEDLLASRELRCVSKPDKEYSFNGVVVAWQEVITKTVLCDTDEQADKKIEELTEMWKDNES